VKTYRILSLHIPILDDTILAVKNLSKPFEEMDYDDIRAFNIRRNEEFLQKLGISNLFACEKNQKPTESRKRKKRSESPDDSVLLSDHASDGDISITSDSDNAELEDSDNEGFEDLAEWDEVGPQKYWNYVGKIFRDKESQSDEWSYWQIFTVAKYYTFSKEFIYVWRYTPYGSKANDQDYQFTPCEEMLNDPNVELDCEGK
jgi:hypothetical protein